MKKTLVSVAMSLITISFCHGSAVMWNNAWMEYPEGPPRLWVAFTQITSTPGPGPDSNIVGYTITDLNIASTPTQAVMTLHDSMLASQCSILLLPVSYGTPIDDNLFVNSTDPFFRTYNPATGISISQTGLTLSLYETVFLACVAGGLDTATGIYNTWLYGWVELGYKDGEVYVVNSAHETTGLGIYAGTGIAVPEPSAVLLALSGLSLLLLRRRCRK